MLILVLYIKIKNIPIQRVSHVKFLGITIHEKLSWNQHTDAILSVDFNSKMK